MVDIIGEFISAIEAETHVEFKKESEDTYIARIEFEGGRFQKVMVSFSKDESGDPTVEYYSRVTEITEENTELYKTALKINLQLIYGALAVLDNHLIIVQTLFLKDLDPQRFIKSLFYVAARADELEEELTQADRN